MIDKIQDLSSRAVELTQNRPNGTCEMSKYNKVFAQLIIDECCQRMEYATPDRIVPRPTWQIYEHFGLDWKNDWKVNNYGQWEKIKND